MCEDVAAQIGDNAFAERRDEVVAKRACGRQHRGNADHDQKIAVDEGDALGRKAEVDHAPNGDRHDQRRQRGNNQGAERRQCAPAVAPDIGEKRSKRPQIHPALGRGGARGRLRRHIGLPAAPRHLCLC